MKTKIKIICGIAVNAAALMAVHSVGAQAVPPADNTKSNQTDQSNRQVTADSQKENAADRGLVQRIRKNLMAEKDLSTYAHNVKIVAVGGQVTLNGVVRSDEEKQKVERLAQEVAGKQNVVNDLKVAPQS
ncbi:MAG: BON domain-containing protein [Pseudomonadota bacterium]|nr:BON domain-containing protein [Pseudomonadota bacterium]